MSKLSYEEKIEIYNKRKAGVTLNTLHSKYGITKHNIQYLVWLIDRHGFDILKHTKNKYYPPYQKEQIINRVLLNNESIQSVSVDEGLPSEGMLHTWIKKYKEMGYNIVERKRGRSTMPKKSTKPPKNETIEEKVKRLEEENLYLKAELDYSKKLRAVVQARTNQQQKKK